MAVELATAYINLVPSAKGITDNIASALGAPLAAAATSSGGAASEGFLGSFAARLGALPGIVKTAFVAVAAFAPLAGLAALGDSFDKAYDKIRIGTGATGTALQGLESSFKQVAKSVPSSFGDVSTTIADLNTRLGLTGKPLEELSKNFLDLSRITKTDLSANIKSTTGLFNQFGIAAGDQSAKLNVLFRVAQATGTTVGDLAAAMSQGGAQFRSAGFTFDQTAALLGLLAKNGLDAGAVIPALSRAMATAAKDGKPAQEVFRDVFDTIRNAPNDTEAAGAALDVFGARAGPKLAALIREGKLSYEEFTQAIGSGDTISQAAKDTDDWREALDTLKNTTLVALEPLAIGVFNGITKAVEAITPAIETAAGVIDIFFGAFTGTGGTEVFGVSANLARSVANIGIKARELADKAGPAITGFFRELADALAPLVTDFLPRIIGFFGDLGQRIADNGPIMAVANSALGLLKDHLSEIVIALAAAAVAMKTLQTASAIGGSLSVVAAALQPIAYAAGFLVGALEALGIALAGVFGAPVVITVAIIAAIAAALALLYFKVKPVHDAFDALGRMFAGAFKASVGWVADTALPALRSAFDGLSPVLDAVTSAVEPIVGAFVDLGEATVVAWRAFRAGIQPTVDWYNAHVGPTITAAVELIIAIFERLAQVTRLIWRQISGQISLAVEIIEPIITGIIDLVIIPLRLAFEILASSAVVAFGIMSSIISATIGIVGPILGGFVALVTGLLGPLFDFVVSGTELAFGALADIVGGALDIVRGILDILTGLITLDWSKAWDGVKEIFQGVWDIIVTIVSTSINVVKDTITLVVAAIDVFLQAAWETIKGVAVGAWNGFRDIIVSTVTGVVTFIAGLPQMFVNALGDILHTLVSKGHDLIQGLLDGITAKVNDVTIWFGHLAADTIVWIGNTLTTLTNKGIDLITGFLIGAIQKVVDVVGWLGHLGSDAASWVGDLSGKLFAKGVEIIQGFIDGIRKKAAEIPGIIASAVNPGAAIGNFIGSHVPNPFSATGRLVDKGPLATIVGEAGPEAIINADQAVRLVWNLANTPLFGAASAAPPSQATGASYVYAPTVTNEITPERVMDAFHTLNVLYG